MACKRWPRVRRWESDADPGVLVELTTDIASVLIRVVDSTGVGVAWELGVDGDAAGELFHFAAGESIDEDHLALARTIGLRITAAAGNFVEVLTWAG